MGLFWGNDKPKQQQEQPPQQQPQKTPYGNPVIDKETFNNMHLSTLQSLGFCANSSASGDTWLEVMMPNLTCLIHNINRSVYLNNVHINEIKDMMQQLLDENKALRERVDHLERQQASTQSSSTHRTNAPRSMAI
ncbi:hypothetical protein [uncultured Selenomonas sp.]|uniref:hypothetical protein n=1 Tax=uncultured Selenomonas sp. TaxID=159275 RepID=UPI0028E1DF09|nr:hypothetical protein [uncultured Selenomonas sp.]